MDEPEVKHDSLLEKENISVEENVSEENVETEEKIESSKPPNQNFLVPDLPVNVNNLKQKTLDAKSKTPEVQEDVKKSNSKNELPYSKPSWGGQSPEDKKYSITILKDGIVKDTLLLSNKEIITFGRLDQCDVTVEHPSCSRYHALLQYCIEEKDKRKKGFYLYDLDSTHGTYLNKTRIKPKVFNRVRVGYQIKFGGSSRLYIVEGPDEDQEEEVAMDDFRIKKQQYKEQKLEEKQKRKPVKAMKPQSNDDEKEEEVDSDSQDEGAGWGFREDAQEEGINLQDLLNKRKEFEVKDPKKTLRNFFEREGLEFEYDMSTSGSSASATHLAKVSLPLDTIDGAEVIAEGRSSNKKDAVLACATDACRLLQAYDAMQSAPKEDEGLKRRKQLEANDFYESDDDEFLDRTGSIEKKRLKRKKWAGKDESAVEVDTYDTLKTKVIQKEKELQEIQTKLERARTNELNVDTDSLDAYMISMKNSLDKTTKMKMKRHTLELKDEIKKLHKLIEKVKPTSLPELTKYEDLKSKTDTNNSTALNNDHKTSEEPVKSISKPQEKPLSKETLEHADNRGKDISKDEFSVPEPPVKKVKKKVYAALPKPKPSSSSSTNSKQSGEKATSKFVGWLPPEGQSGDGRTSLNDKFGY